MRRESKIYIVNKKGNEGGEICTNLMDKKCRKKLSQEAMGAQGCTRLAMGKSSSKQFNNEALIAHNEYRKQHDISPLKLCKNVNQEAQQYSDVLASTEDPQAQPGVQSWPLWRELVLGILLSDRKGGS